jgi:phage terminase large subunit-like protein
VKPTFWLPGEGLKEKSRADRVPYDLWADEGLLETTPGKAIEYEWVAHRLFEFVAEHNVKKIAFDRWGMKYLKPWLLKAGFTEEQVAKTGCSRVRAGLPVDVAGASRLEAALLARRSGTAIIRF